MVADQKITDRFAIYNGDSCEVLPKLKKESIHLSIHSPPFRGLFQYSSNTRDLSNCRTPAEFFAHYEFIVKELHRITLPGRIAAVHCMDIPTNGANICGYDDFPGDIIRLFQANGFDYLPRIVIWKEPLGVRRRTMAKALAHATIVEDSTLTNCAAADYLIPFRKRGENPVPVTHERGLLEYYGEKTVPADRQSFRGYEGDQIKNIYSHWIWRRYAACMWDDIRIDNVVEFEQARDENDERHPHPLQLDVIARACELWSNPGEIVLTPFMGVGSEVVGALANGRKAIGIELKDSYYKQAVKNINVEVNGEKKTQAELIPQSPVTDDIM